MVLKNLSLLVALALSGCAVFEPLDDLIGLDEQSQQTERAQELADGSPLASSVNFQRQFKQISQQQKLAAKDAELQAKMLLNKQKLAAKDAELQAKMLLNKQNPPVPYKVHDINHYVRGLMQDLVANLQYVNATTPVAVVSFVMLNGDYNEANILGIQIAESLMHEVHKFGIPVIDFKTTGYIRITDQGDFAFSKDYEDFSGEMPARYIVGGTMLKNAGGYLINARIVGVKSQAIVASAQSFIPNSVSDPILMLSAEPKSSNTNNSVELGSMAFPQNNSSAFVSAKTENNVNQNQPMNNIAKTPYSNSVSLIQE